LLAGSGLTFGVIGVAAIFAPDAVAARYGLHLDSVGGRNEFRAIFTGFWLALGVTMITAARKPALVILGDLCGLMLLLQALGRALSFALDGVPDPTFVSAFAGELVTAVGILAIRPPRVP
jgi:hypothetical protein